MGNFYSKASAVGDGDLVVAEKHDKPFRFMALPPEIRSRILGQLFTQPWSVKQDVTDPRKTVWHVAPYRSHYSGYAAEWQGERDVIKSLPGLLLVNRQFCSEVVEALLRSRRGIWLGPHYTVRSLHHASDIGRTTINVTYKRFVNPQFFDAGIVSIALPRCTSITDDNFTMLKLRFPNLQTLYCAAIDEGMSEIHEDTLFEDALKGEVDDDVEAQILQDLAVFHSAGISLGSAKYIGLVSVYACTDPNFSKYILEFEYAAGHGWCVFTGRRVTRYDEKAGGTAVSVAAVLSELAAAHEQDGT